MQNVVYDVRRYYRVVAPFLDAELTDRGDELLWRAIGREGRAGSILELGCGSGRVTALLAEAGARVVGLDLSPELLDQARRRLDSSGVLLVQGDMRDLPLRAAFDVVVAADDPFSHLAKDEDRDRALAAVAAHLSPYGRFVLDALWLSPQSQSLHSSVRSLELHGQLLEVTERWRCNLRTHRCSAEYDYRTGAGQPAHAAFRARCWTPRELDHRLTKAGLVCVSRWGGYDRRPWDEERSEHLIVEARLSPAAS